MNSKIYLESIRCPHCGIPTGYVEFPENGEIPCYNCGNPVLRLDFLNEEDKLYYEMLEKQEQGKFYKAVEKKFEEKNGELFIKGKKVIKAWESFSGWYWFATEKTDEFTYFGLVQGFEEEWGYWDIRELNGIIKKGLAWEIPKKDLIYSGRR